MENKEPFIVPRSIENAVEKITVHEGTFHADEVFADAILKDLFPEFMKIGVSERVNYVEYIRTRDPDILKEASVSKENMLVDVGGKYDPAMFNFDHHQFKGAGSRENGVGYAAAGLVWKHYGKEWIDYIENYTRLLKNDNEEEAEQNRIENGEVQAPLDTKSSIEKNTGVERNERPRLTDSEKNLIWEQMDKNYVQFFDANDTGQLEGVTCNFANGTSIGGFQFTLPEIVRLANVDQHDGRNQYKRFKDTVEMFRSITFSMVNKYVDLVEGLREFDIKKCEFSADKKTVIINQTLLPAVNSYLIENNEEFKNVEFYAVLNTKNEYSITVAPVGEGMRDYRNPNMIPKELRLGNKAKDINKLMGIPDGVTFVHTAGFFANCKDAESAKKLMEYSVSKEK